MKLLKRMVRNWLHSDLPEVAHEGGPNPVNMIGSVDNPSILMVAPIENGFLVMNRKYNAQGPDTGSAMFAADAENLAAALVNRLAHNKLTAR